TQVECGTYGSLRARGTGVYTVNSVGVLGIRKIPDKVTHVRGAGLGDLGLTDVIYRVVLGKGTVTDKRTGNNNLFYFWSSLLLGQGQTWHYQCTGHTGLDQVAQVTFAIVIHTAASLLIFHCVSYGQSSEKTWMWHMRYSCQSRSKNINR